LAYEAFINWCINICTTLKLFCWCSTSINFLV